MPPAAIGAVFVALGATAATGAAVAAIATAAYIGAAVGAVIGGITAAVKGQNILKGALMGGVTGFVSGAAFGALGAAVGPATAGTVATEGAATGAVEAGAVGTGEAVVGGLESAELAASTGNAGSIIPASAEVGTSVASAAPAAAAPPAQEGLLSGAMKWINTNPGAASVIGQGLGGAAKAMFESRTKDKEIAALMERDQFDRNAKQITGLTDIQIKTPLPSIATFAERPGWVMPQTGLIPTKQPATPTPTFTLGTQNANA